MVGIVARTVGLMTMLPKDQRKVSGQVASRTRPTCRASGGLGPSRRFASDTSAILLVVALTLVNLHPTAARAMTGQTIPDPAGLCEAWAAIAAAEHGVPEALMIGITRVEAGRGTRQGLRGWPWTVNSEGEGRWFRTRAEAHAYAADRHAAGAQQIDIGCFQLNVGWHGRAFSDLDAMLDPAGNARYAARFLSALKDELGDWTRAAAAYHSRTPHIGRAYIARLGPVIETIRRPSAPDAPPVEAAPPRASSGEGRGLGSLVPLASLSGASPFESRPATSRQALR